MRFLGIDGGGTKTAFILTDENGNVLAQAEQGTIHIRQVDISEFERRIRAGLAELADNMGEELHIDNSFVAIPGYGEFPDEIAKFDRVLQDIFAGGSFQTGNDCVVGWAAMGARPGVNMVMGTGAIAYGRDSCGNESRSSGWGPFCGDEGSAYWLGKKLLELFGKQSDGRLKRDKLYDIVREELKLERDFDIIDYVTMTLKADRTSIAGLSKLLYRAAEAGDESAAAAFEAAANEAAAAILAVVRSLHFNEDEPIYIGCSGGVFRSGELIMKPLMQALSVLKNVKESDISISPVKGAALMACKGHGIEITAELLAKWSEK